MAGKEKEKVPNPTEAQPGENINDLEVEKKDKEKVQSKDNKFKPKKTQKEHCSQKACMLLMPPKLPTFAGDHLKFKTFVTKFKVSVTNRTHDYGERLTYLHECLEGDAARLISRTWNYKPKRGYRKAWKLLQEEYGDPQVMVTVCLSRLTKWPKIGDDDHEGLQELADFLQECLSVIKSAESLTSMDSFMHVYTVFMKLPPCLQSRWNERAFEL